MATLQSPGISSGLDVNGIVQQLVAAERAPAAARIAREKSAVATQVSAIGTLKGALSSFKSTLDPLKTVEAFGIRSAKSSDEEIFTASAKSGAATGSYAIEVNALATAHQIASNVFAGGSATAVGTGTLGISLGSTSFNVVIDSTSQTLAGIRDAINKASGNPGVRATIVNESGGAHLILSSAKTGAANVIKVITDSNDGLAQLTYEAGVNTANYEQKKPAGNASISVAGYPRSAETNSISDAIDGVTLNLIKADLNVEYTVTIDENRAAATTRVQNFVSQYNAAFAQLAKLGQFDASNGTGGPLLGDALLRSISAELRRGASDAVSSVTGDYKLLADLGITTARDGTLTLDEAKLSAALSANFDAVASVFGSANGVAARLSAAIGKRLVAGGDVAVRNTNLDKRSKNVQLEEQQLAVRMARVEERLRAQFVTLDGVLSKLQSTSTFLTQQLTASLAAGNR